MRTISRYTVVLLAAVIAGFLGFSAAPARAQIGFVNGFVNSAPGVIIDTNGFVHAREGDDRQDLAAMRKRAKDAPEAAKHEQLAFISLPKLFAQAKAAIDAGQPIPEELRYVGGITQLRYVFVYPEEKDLIIAGPAEPWTASGVNAFGKRSGRPVLQLDDLVVAMRTSEANGGKLFGCGIWPDPKSVKIAEQIAQQMAARPRSERADALRKALGPQEVKVFGTWPDTRMALVCVAADYKLKRMALGVESVPTVPIGNAIGAGRSAANKYWFKASFDPLLVSADGNAYQIRGQRLAVDCGMFDFDPRGATEKAQAWTKKFSAAMPALTTAVPLYADLQNVADLALFSNLLRQDRLASKVGWDTSWVMSEGGYPVTKVPAPKTAETIVNFTNGSMAAGGVMMETASFAAPNNRQSDKADTLVPPRQQAKTARAAAPNSAPIYPATQPAPTAPTTRPAPHAAR